MKKLLFASLIFSNFLFSQVGPPEPRAMQVDWTSFNNGANGNFTVRGWAPRGVADMKELAVSIGSPNMGPGTCTVMLYQGVSVILLNDAGNDWTGFTLGDTTSTTENSKCKVTANGTSKQLISAWEQWFSFSVQFKNTFNGQRTVSGWAGDANWASSGPWTFNGYFTVNGVTAPPGPPTITSLSPTTSSAGSQYFTVSATDLAGVAHIQYISYAIGGHWTAHGCTIVEYPNGAGGLLLLNDAGNGWITTAPFRNSQCEVSAPSYSAGGNVGTVGAQVTALAGFSGAKTISGQVVDNSNNYTVNSNLGTWTIPTMDMSLTATEINTHELLLDDATGQYIERPTSISPWIVRLKNGKNVHVAAADNVRVKSVSHSWEPVGDSYVYHFKIDTSDAPYIMRLGITEDQYVPIGESSEQTQPKGWHGLVQAWANLGEAELSDSSEFSLKSKWRPGLQAFFIMSDKAKEPIPSFPETENNVRIATAASIFNNSVRKFVIGPAIAPDLSEDGLHELVQRWVEDYGFGFLGPYLSGQPLSEIRANDAFEQEILDCLKAATAK